MNHLYRALLMMPLALVQCFSNLCGEPSEGTDTSTGSFTYVESNAPKPGHTTTSGPLTLGLSVSATADGSFGVSGTILDVSGQAHDFQLNVVGVSGGTTAPIGAGSTMWIGDCGPADGGGDGGAGYDGSCVYINQTTVPLSGTISTSSFTTDCHGDEGCALTIVGTLQATASWGDASLTTDLSLNHESVWQTFACPASSNSSDSS
jgi:hypothetical protein